MKYLNIKQILALAILLTITLNGCKKSEPGETEPTEQELALQALEGTWTLANGGSILLDDRDLSANYNGFAVTLAEGTYSTLNAGNLFSASGTWTWLGASSTQFSLDDGKTITIEEVGANRWVFSFNQSSGGTAAGVDGFYRITLTK